jgi:hypothetical protein
MELTWLLKFKIIRALTSGETSLLMRDDGSWYLHQSGVERKEGGCLSGGCDSGRSPEEATEQHWKWITDPKYYIVIGAMSEQRRAVRWNGFMWEDVVEEKQC